MRVFRPLFAALCASFLLQAALSPSEQQLIDFITSAELKAHVSFLASDPLEGRDTPSRGLDVAAEYIASEFRRAGLEPAGDNGYFQTASYKGAKVRNVAAILPGSDRKLKRTFLMVSAHYDHIGAQGTGPAERIYNGANDDASGTSSMLALAEAFARLSERPRRSLLFIAYLRRGEGAGRLALLRRASAGAAGADGGRPESGAHGPHRRPRGAERAAALRDRIRLLRSHRLAQGRRPGDRRHRLQAREELRPVFRAQ